MSEPLPIPSRAASVGRREATPASRKSDAGGAAAFKALLDELEQRAQALEVESAKDLTQDDLAGAVDNARISLNQMLSLKDQLLEAWQASQIEAPRTPGAARD